jgi:plasmid stabilization system protein ParE
MPRGDKSKYTDKQKRQAEHIEQSYEERGLSEDEVEARGWATVNKTSGGGKKSGSGQGKTVNTEAKKSNSAQRKATRTQSGKKSITTKKQRSI